MDRGETYDIAQKTLLEIEAKGFDSALENVGLSSERTIRAESGVVYDLETQFEWQDLSRTKIRVVCRVTPQNWYRHEQLEEAITLCATAI